MIHSMLNFFRRLIPDHHPIRLFYHKAVALTAAILYGFPSRNLKVIAVTGTCGKTTTCHFIAEILQDADLKANIEYWLYQLTDKQREVLARRFGLLNFEPATLEEVGNEIGLTRERVRQIQVEALRRLREMLEKQGLSIEALFH